MVTRGADRYRDRLASARGDVTDTRGNRRDPEMTKLRPYRRVMETLVADMARSLKVWLNATAKSQRNGGAVPLAFAKLKTLPPELSSYITVRTVLDSMTIQRLGHLGVAKEVGQALEYEARISAWLEDDTGLWKEVQKTLRNQRATASHKKRVNINRFNKLLKDKVGWINWGPDERLHTGLKLVEILSLSTGHFSIEEDPTFIRTGKERARSCIVPSDELIQYLMEATEEDAERCPQFMPTLIPPKRWEGVRRGGYYTRVLRVPNLIRFKADNEESQGVATDEYDSLDMPRVYSALAAVQEVPWRINQPVLRWVLEAWDRDLGIAGLAKQEPSAIPPRPAELEAIRAEHKGEHRARAEEAWIKEHPEAFRDWKRDAAKVYGANARRISQGMSVRTTIQLAERYRNEEFYFPHVLDFRGRMYPIPAYLQPQGNDLARGLLTFAEGRPLGERGGWWLAVHLANCAGIDKVSWEERVAWVTERMDLWRKIAANPLQCMDWVGMDDNPWQLLAAILEFVRAVDGGEGDHTISALPIRVDGTCNGIQHLSAMMRDPVAGAAVNLYPSEAPRDIYGEVAEDLEERLEVLEEAGGLPGQRAATWRSALFTRPDAPSPRKFTKTPVMVMPYGGTRQSYIGAVQKWLEKYDADRKHVPLPPIEDPKERSKADFMETVWIANQTWESVKGKVEQGMIAMGWLQDCAEVLAQVNQPITWTTPSGFHVRHFYGKLRERRIETKVDGRTMRLVDYERTKDLSKREQMQGISPNFVHSMDASVNMETAINFAVASRGAPFTTIHDSFGSVPGEMDKLHDVLRYAFVWVHKRDVMDEFRQRCVIMLRDHMMATTTEAMSLERAWEAADDIVPQVPQRGDLVLEEVLNAEYFFA
jgi:DNA-directed RNA polymerase